VTKETNSHCRTPRFINPVPPGDGFLLGIILDAGSGYPEVIGAKELMNLESFPDNTSGPLAYVLEYEV